METQKTKQRITRTVRSIGLAGLLALSGCRDYKEVLFNDQIDGQSVRLTKVSFCMQEIEVARTNGTLYVFRGDGYRLFSLKEIYKTGKYAITNEYADWEYLKELIPTYQGYSSRICQERVNQFNQEVTRIKSNLELKGEQK